MARSTLGAIWPAAVAAGGVLLACMLAFQLRGFAAFVEGGPIETASALAYGVAAIACAASALRPDGGRERVWGAVLLAALCARELDMHKALPVGSLTRSATYVDPAMPLAWRVGAAMLVLVLVAAAIAFLWSAVRQLRRGALAFDHRVAGVVVAICVLGVAKTIDGLGRKLGDVGLTMSPMVERAVEAFEESLELAAPVVLLWVVLDLLVRQRPIEPIAEVAPDQGARARP